MSRPLFARKSRRRRGQTSAVAALEFAIIAPTLLFIGAGVLDAGYAFSTKIRVTNAASVAALYAYENGQGLDLAEIQNLLPQIQAVAAASETFVTPPTVAVNYNEPLSKGASQIDTSDVYCITSPDSASWKITDTAGATCPAAKGATPVTPGVFITLSVSESFVPIFAFDAPIFGGLNLTSTATVRVQ